MDVSKWLHCVFLYGRLEKYQPTIVKAKTSATAGLCNVLKVKIVSETYFLCFLCFFRFDDSGE